MRMFFVSSLIVLLAGCGESPPPAKRFQPAESAPEANTPAAEARAPGSETASLAPAAKPQELGPEVDLRVIRLTAPDAWKRNPPRSRFVLAEFTLPKAEGDAQDGRLTVSTAGGSVEANVDRWRQQFGGKPDKESKKSLDVAGLTVTIVDFAGSYLDQPDPFAAGVKREGYRMLTAIVPTGTELHFVKCYGPEKTIAQQAEAFEAFVKTLQVKK